MILNITHFYNISTTATTINCIFSYRKWKGTILVLIGENSNEILGTCPKISRRIRYKYEPYENDKKEITKLVVDDSSNTSKNM